MISSFLCRTWIFAALPQSRNANKYWYVTESVECGICCCHRCLSLEITTRASNKCGCQCVISSFPCWAYVFLHCLHGSCYRMWQIRQISFPFISHMPPPTTAKQRAFCGGDRTQFLLDCRFAGDMWVETCPESWCSLNGCVSWPCDLSLTCDLTSHLSPKI